MSTPPDGCFLSDRYDELRREVLDRGIVRTRGDGLALFLRQGMANWMRAWLCFTPQRKGVEKIVDPPKPPLDHKRELVEILSAMVMKSVAGNL